MEEDDCLLQQQYRSLEKIYFKLRGWHQTYPDLRPLLLFETVCPTCQSTRIQFNGGIKVTKRTVKQQFRCGDCGQQFYQ
jgi:hypothetical protein